MGGGNKTQTVSNEPPPWLQGMQAGLMSDAYSMAKGYVPGPLNKPPPSTDKSLRMKLSDALHKAHGGWGWQDYLEDHPDYQQQLYELEDPLNLDPNTQARRDAMNYQAGYGGITGGGGPAQGGGIIDPNTGLLKFQANVNPYQWLASDMMGQNIGQLPGLTRALSRQYSGAMGYLLDPGNLNIDQNPYFNPAVTAATRPVTQQLLEQALPAIRSGAGEAGQYGSTRQGVAEGLALDRYTQNIGDISSRMAMDLYSRQLGGLISGSQMAPQYTETIQDLFEAPAKYAAGAGAYTRQLEQEEIAEPWRRMDWLRQFIPQGGYGSSTTSPAPQQDTLSSLSGIASIIAMFL